MSMKLILRILKGSVKVVFYSFLIVNLLILIIPLLFNTSCKENKNLEKFDVIIVLGSPSNSDCTPHIIMQTRVNKAVSLFNKNKVKALIFSGASVQNSCSEAQVMATYAVSLGIPKDAIILEEQARNTSENAYYSVRLMKKQQFKKALIVTSKPHIKRACMVFSKYAISFKMLGANYPDDSTFFGKIAWFMGERMILSHHLVFGFPKIN